MRRNKLFSILSIIVLIIFVETLYAQIHNLPFPEIVSSVAFSPDGRYVAGSISSDNHYNKLNLWTSDGNFVKSFDHKSISYKVNSIAFSPDGRYIVAAGISMNTLIGILTIWEIESGEIIHLITIEKEINDVAFSPDGKYIALACDYKFITLLTGESFETKQNLHGHKRTVNSVVFGKGNKYLFSGSKDKSIIQWDIEMSQIARTFVGHESPVTSINISSDGNFLASGASDGTIKVWDLDRGSETITITMHHLEPITSLCFSTDGRYIISASKDKTSKMFELQSGLAVRSYVGHVDGINDVDISRDSKLIATASDDKTIKIWPSNIQPETSLKEVSDRTTELSTIDPNPPVIVWISPYNASETSLDEEYPLRVHIQSASKLDKVNILHNSRVEEFNLENYNSQQAQTDLTIDEKITLEEGNNSLIILANNSEGSTTSEIRSVVYELEEKTTDFEVNWIIPSSDNYHSSEEHFAIKACINSLSKIDQVSLFINDDLWTFDRSIPFDPTSECNLDFEKEIQLKEGNNEIKLEVVTADNNTYEASRNVMFQQYTGEPEKRLALIIGNSDYQHGELLLNPVNDALAMADVLKSVGFDVLTHTNANQKTIKMAMDEFGEKLDSYDVGLFYYAGHGVQVSGYNYVIPVDATLYKEQDVDYDCVEVGRILGKMEASACTTNIVILDACRDNPFERRWSGRSVKTKGLAFMSAPSGSFIAYATSPGNTASDGVGENGLYTGTLIKYIQTPGLTIENVFKNVRSEVENISNGTQIPWEATSLKGGDFYFLRK